MTNAHATTDETTTPTTERIAAARAELRAARAILRERKRAQRAAFAVDADQAALHMVNP
ncbi:MAG: hypothetical protein JST00_20025 [Deltaproteobacteria bacterium]|nr:hypothetical protein [Deltaproteobacteria bacterium]